jgi:hypothetical protein
VVPRGDELGPKASRGWSLGNTVITIRNLDTYAKQVAADKEELERMGFCFTSIAERDWKERVLPALATYRREFGECLVRQTFVVPWELPWPEKAWGMKLGVKLGDMRRKGTFFAHIGRDAERLDALGFNLTLRADAFQERVVPLIELYKSVTGTQAIPAHFVIPSEARGPRRCGEFIWACSWLATRIICVDWPACFTAGKCGVTRKSRRRRSMLC